MAEESRLGLGWRFSLRNHCCWRLANSSATHNIVDSELVDLVFMMSNKYASNTSGFKISVTMSGPIYYKARILYSDCSLGLFQRRTTTVRHVDQMVALSPITNIVPGPSRSINKSSYTVNTAVTPSQTFV